ncbi:hypothetical protein BG004_002753 [Podila humilis]|nr:hypothetical protein BG004_002753 [Podila humilis]
MGFRWPSPMAQVIAVGFICFCCPGMFNALNSMGGGGQIESNVDQNANVALYTMFALGGLFAGAIHNKLGPKWTIFLGTLTYVLYAASYVIYNEYKTGWVVILAGGILGMGAGMLWTAQGAMMMAYPREAEKGKFIGIFWAVFNSGGVVGSLMNFLINRNKEKKESLGNGTYAAFLSVMAIGTLISLTLVAPSRITRSNGERIKIQKFPTWSGEVVAILKLFLDWRMVVMIPMFLSSNWFYSYHYGAINGFYFSMRTQAFNNIWYWFAQIFGSFATAKVLDYQGVNRRTRARWGLFLITIFFVATWTGGIFFQKTYNNDSEINMDFLKDGGAAYAGPLFMYMFYGFNDAAWQTYCYWLMGALSNDVTVLSRYSGFYKGVQSAGAAVAWRISAVGTPFMTELLICFGLLIASIPGALYLAMRLEDHSIDEDSTDEVQVHEEKQEQKHEV